MINKLYLKIEIYVKIPAVKLEHIDIILLISFYPLVKTHQDENSFTGTWFGRMSRLQFWS